MTRKMVMIGLVMCAGLAGGDSCTDPSGSFGSSQDRNFMVVVSRDPNTPDPRIRDRSRVGDPYFPEHADWHFHWLDASWKPPVPKSGVLEGVTEYHRHFSVFVPKRGGRFILFDPSSGSKTDRRPRLLVYALEEEGAKLIKRYTLEELLGSKEELEKVTGSLSHIQWIRPREAHDKGGGALYDEDGDLFYIHTAWMTYVKVDLSTGAITRGGMKE